MKLRLIENRPKIQMELEGQDGNAFSILGRFSNCAKRSGWSQEEISEVVKLATAGDYDNLLNTIVKFVE